MEDKESVKRRIAQAASEIISHNETVMIESGSLCAILAEEIAKSRRNVTVITNSVSTANFLKSRMSVRIILLGGEFQQASQVMIGVLLKKCAANFHVDKLFLEADGFNELGAMSDDSMRAQAVRDMAQGARKIVILAESDDFNKEGTVPLLSYEEIDSIYTDNQISDTIIEKIQSKGVKIFLV